MSYEIEYGVKMGEATHENSGLNGNVPRDDRTKHLMKGYYLEHETHVHNINKLIWATNPYLKNNFGTKYIDCSRSLDHNGGSCFCPSNTWLRG